MLKRVVNALMAAAVLVSPVVAQRGHAPGVAMSRSATSVGLRDNQHGAFPGSVFLGSPFWWDGASQNYSQTPSVIVVQPATVSATNLAKPAEDAKPIIPLMIEWQGDRYVRRSEAGTTGTRDSQPDYIAETKAHAAEKHATTEAQPRAIASPPADLQPATFVFRDGHREQSSDYSIISGVIYARGDYWTSGNWSRQIPVSQLDLPATFKANHDNGVPFRLPGAPNEVVTRP
jgi:hypothetical protein